MSVQYLKMRPVLCINVMLPSAVLSSAMNISWYLIYVQMWMGNVTFFCGAAVFFNATL